MLKTSQTDVARFNRNKTFNARLSSTLFTNRKVSPFPNSIPTDMALIWCWMINRTLLEPDLLFHNKETDASNVLKCLGLLQFQFHLLKALWEIALVCVAYVVMPTVLICFVTRPPGLFLPVALLVDSVLQDPDLLQRPRALRLLTPRPSKFNDRFCSPITLIFGKVGTWKASWV